jgi:hypothetical protein
MHSNLPLTVPDNVVLPSANNSFTSSWADKRSAPYFGISIVIRGTGTIAGTIHFQFSNAIEGGAPGQSGGGGGYGQPAPGVSGTAGNPDDATTYAGWDIAVASAGVYQLTPTYPTGHRWVRVKYVASSSAAGMTASVYFNGTFSS